MDDPVFNLVRVRDTLDWLVAVFTILTGLVLAVAGLYALLIARGRYIRDASPDLRLGSSDTFQFLALPPELPWADKPPSVALSANVPINSIGPEAWNLTVTVRTAVHGTASSSAPSWMPLAFYGLDPTPEGEVSEPGPVFAGDGASLWLRFGIGYVGKLSTDQVIERFVQDAALAINETTITLTYYSKREIVLFLMHPFGLGRLKFRRERQFQWRWQEGSHGHADARTFHVSMLT